MLAAGTRRDEDDDDRSGLGGEYQIPRCHAQEFVGGGRPPEVPPFGHGLLPPARRVAATRWLYPPSLLKVRSAFADGAATLDELTWCGGLASRAYYAAARAAVGNASRGRAVARRVGRVGRPGSTPRGVEPRGDGPAGGVGGRRCRMAGVAPTPVNGPSRPAGLEGGTRRTETVQSHLVRCVFGNPFRPVAFAPLWRTPRCSGTRPSIYD